jgi:hypothetical protein
MMEKARADPKRGNKGGIDTRMMIHICKPKGEHLQPPSTGNENKGMLQAERQECDGLGRGEVEQAIYGSTMPQSLQILSLPFFRRITWLYILDFSLSPWISSALPPLLVGMRISKRF